MDAGSGTLMPVQDSNSVGGPTSHWTYDDDFEVECCEIVTQFGVDILGDRVEWKTSTEDRSLQEYDDITIDIDLLDTERDDDDDDDDYENEDEDDNVDVPDHTARSSTKDNVSQETLLSHDKEEKQKEEAMFGEDVTPCCLKKCNTKVPRDIAMNARRRFQQLSKKEQDMILLAHINFHQRVPQLQKHYGAETKRGAVRKRPGKEDSFKRHSRYFFHDLEICRTFFYFLHDVRKKRMQLITQHFLNKELTPREHGNVGKRSTNKDVITLEEYQQIITFITQYAEKHALPLPVRIPDCKSGYDRVLKLPAAITKAKLYRQYHDAVKISADQSLDTAAVKPEPPLRLVSPRAFENIWKTHLPHILTTKPTYDLCNICSNNTLAIVRSMNEDEKHAALESAEVHLKAAQTQREYYDEKRRMARQLDTVIVDGVECTFKVLSFDFTERVHYPSSARQVGPACFKSLRKCGAFGVHDERTRIQTNYLIDEADSIGEGPDAVISMLHHYLSQNTADVLILFANNFVDHNENNAILNYLQWRVATKPNVKIELNFTIPGHTEFSPGRSFGVWKARYSRANVQCLEDLVELIETPEGSLKKYNIAIPTILNEERNVIWYKWVDYLTDYYREVPGTITFQKFVFQRGKRMLASWLSNDSTAQSFALETESVDFIQANVIEEIIPEAMSAARQWYLYEQIRCLCDTLENMDKVAPLPHVPKPRVSEDETSSYAEEMMPSEATAKKPRARKSMSSGSGPGSEVPKKRGRPR